MGESPQWSVIIPTWRAQQTIGQCLQSLHEQVAAPSFEILVVDSSDDVGTALEVERNRPTLPDLRYIHLPTRAFPGVARNAGVKAARGNWILFLDADVVAAADLLAQAEALRGPGLFGGAIGLIGSSAVSARLRHLFEFKGSLPGVAHRRTWELPTACLAIRREEFIATEGFANLRASEDWLFNWECWRRGEAMRFEPRLRVNHATPEGWVSFLRYARLLGEASGTVRRLGGLPGQWVVRHPWLAVLLPFGRTFRALVWCARYSSRDFRLLLWAWPLYLFATTIWAIAFRRGVVRLPPSSLGS